MNRTPSAAALEAVLPLAAEALAESIHSTPRRVDLLLFCPVCGHQHIDAPEPASLEAFDSGADIEYIPKPAWTNPPHRSHLCHRCRHVWRPSDEPTNGVAVIGTRGQGDTWVHTGTAAAGLCTEGMLGGTSGDTVTRADGQVGVACIEKLRALMVRIGVFPGEGLEWFAANLESNLYSIARTVNAMIDHMATAAAGVVGVPVVGTGHRDVVEEIVAGIERLEKTPEPGRTKILPGYDEGFNDALDLVTSLANSLRAGRFAAPLAAPLGGLSADPFLPAPASHANTSGRVPRAHELKTDPATFEAVLDGGKTHELRLNDRDFQVGDALRLRETRHTGEQMRATPAHPLEYTGRETVRFVSHILEGYGLQPGWIVLSLEATGSPSGVPA